jgi:hypothetical protein
VSILLLSAAAVGIKFVIRLLLDLSRPLVNLTLADILDADGPIS